MNNWKSHFRFNRQERSGIFFLLLLIFLFQVVFYIVKYTHLGTVDRSFLLDQQLQEQIDSMMAVEESKSRRHIKKVNPNYLTDYRGYELGMRLEEINRLHNFRKKDSFVNSLAEFQKVTGISDSMLQQLSVRFSFPEWRQNPRNFSTTNFQESSISQSSKVLKKDLNLAVESELREIRGIGEVLSKRILKFRDALGGFLIDEQIYDVYGLDEVVAERVLERYRVIQKPSVEKLRINETDAGQLSGIVYISDRIAHRIIRFRDSVNGLKSLEELTKIQDFPKEQIERIKLYLTL